MNRFDTIAEAREDLRGLEAKRDQLMLELDRSIAIGQLWEDAFDAGPIKTYIEGNAYNSIKFIIIRDHDSERRMFNLHDVPFLLWDEPVKVQIRNSGGAGNTYRATLLRHERISKPNTVSTRYSK